jgi:hypothetical protein
VNAPLTRRATAEYRTASAGQVEAGHAWYPKANEIARDMAAEHMVTVEVASGILAALSPRLGWGKNVMMAERMLSSGGTLDHGILGRSLAHGRAIYDGAHPLKVMRGPKTVAFYHAILTAGESLDAVIDVHAWAMLVGERGTPPPTVRQYREAAGCMTRAAKILGVGVHDVQATTWLTWRARRYKPGTFDHNPNPTLEGLDQW